MSRVDKGGRCPSFTSRIKATFSRLAQLIPFLQTREGREILFSVVAVLTIIVLGTTGYSLIEDWNWLESLYMTITTLTTIGYGEVHPLSPAGRIFTIVLIVFGVGTVGIVLSTVARKTIDRQFGWLFDRKKMENQIKELKDHTILCGFGRLCRITAQQLLASGTPLVVVDRAPDRIAEAREAGYPVITGDVTSDETLLEAGIQRAKRLVTVLPKDSENLYVVLTSRELNPDIYIISRAEDESGEKRLKRAGANRIVSPYRAGGQKIAYGILRPLVADFIDLAVSGDGPGFSIEEIKVPAASRLVGKTLQETGIRQRSNVMVAAVLFKNGQMRVNPSGDTVIEADATLIALGRKQDFSDLEKLLTESVEARDGAAQIE